MRKLNVDVDLSKCALATTVDPPETIEEVQKYLSISDEEWRKLAKLKKVQPYSLFYFSGQTILQEGITHNQRIYRIQSGECVVTKHIPYREPEDLESLPTCTLKPGAVFGEISFFSSIRSSATIVASKNVEMLTIDSLDIRELYESQPLLVLKLFYNICINLASSLVFRENDGWSNALGK